ncbi:hypothetical protein ACRAWD_24770 [Caulobacter segnis]
MPKSRANFSTRPLFHGSPPRPFPIIQDYASTTTEDFRHRFRRPRHRRRRRRPRPAPRPPKCASRAPAKNPWFRSKTRSSPPPKPICAGTRRPGLRRRRPDERPPPAGLDPAHPRSRQDPGRRSTVSGRPHPTLKGKARDQIHAEIRTAAALPLSARPQPNFSVVSYQAVACVTDTVRAAKAQRQARAGGDAA